MQKNYSESINSIDLKNNVKQLTEWHFDKNMKTTDIYEFNIYGNVVSHKIYNKFDKLTSDFVNNYNSENLFVKQTELITKDTWFFEYNSNNQIIKNIKTDLNKRITNVIKMEYDNGLLKSETVKNYDFCMKYLYEYDSENRITKETEKSCDGDLEGLVEYVYNNKNQIVFEKNYDETGLLSYTIEYGYNENNDQIYKKSDLDSNTVVHFEYEYDINKNWVKQFCIVNGNKELINERQIVYY